MRRFLMASLLVVLLCGGVRAAEAPPTKPRDPVASHDRPLENDSSDLGVGGFGLIIFGLVALSMLPEVFRRSVVYSGTGRRTIWFNSGRADDGRDAGNATGGGNFSGGGAGGNW